MGGSAEGSAKATFPEAHTRSYLGYRKAWKGKAVAKRIPLHLPAARNRQPLRYLDASKRCFSSCRHLVVATDASRVGGQELQLFVVAGQSSDGAFKVCWSPPQVQPLIVLYPVPLDRADGATRHAPVLANT